MLWFAYDGSLNADWLSHYAIRLAKRIPEGQVRAVYVEDGTLSEKQLSSRIDWLAQQAERAPVKLEFERVARRRTVAETLLEYIPKGSDSYVVCGTRIRQRHLSFLAGTVSERLLSAERFNVLAVRVVQPGALGLVNNFLIPVTGHPRGFASGVPFIRLFGEDIQRAHVLLVKALDPLRLHNLSPETAERLQREGWDYVHRVQRELCAVLTHPFHLDGSVKISDRAASEIVLAAKQHRSQLIYVGASERSLSRRLVSGTPIEEILKNAPCDVAIYRGIG